MGYHQARLAHKMIVELFTVRDLCIDLRYGVGWDLEREIDTEQPADYVVYDLIRWAERRRQLGKLIRALADVREIPDLRKLAEEIIESEQQILFAEQSSLPSFYDRILERLRSKLKLIHGLQNCPIVLAGAVYLDLIIQGVTDLPQMNELEDVLGYELVNMQPIETSIGGSIIWIGRYLYLLCDQKTSHLFSMVGSGQDIFSREFESRKTLESISKNPDVPTAVAVTKAQAVPRWMYDHIKKDTNSDTSRTAVTIQLVSTAGRPKLMLTHKGVLHQFDWNTVVQSGLDEILIEGGLMYMGGTLKTSLHSELMNKQYRDRVGNTLVCLDHGSIFPDAANLDAIGHYKNSFRDTADNLIDVYICTLREFCGFFGFSAAELKKRDWKSNAEEIISELAAQESLPAVTVIRDRHLEGSPVYLVFAGKTHPLGKPGRQFGSNNAFNARLISSLTESAYFEEGYTDLLQSLVKVIESAIEAWEAAALGENREIFMTA